MKPIHQNLAAPQPCRTPPSDSTGYTLDVTPRKARAILCVALSLCSATPAFAQSSWEPEPIVDIENGSASGIVSDSAGNIYVAGQLRQTQPDGTTVYHAAVVKSSDGGETWDSNPSTPEVEASYHSPVEASPASCRAIAVTTAQSGPGLFQDQLVTVGVAHGVGGLAKGEWVIHQSLDAGASWSSIAEPFRSGYESQYPEGIAVDSAGNIYVAGSAQERVTTTTKGKTTTTTLYHWVIRKGSKGIDGTYSWSTVGDFRFTTSGQAYGVTCVGTDVFVVGIADSFWEVRKSSNGGAIWEVANRYQEEAGYVAMAFGITADKKSGDLFVVGRATRSGPRRTTEWLWTVRKGTRSGNNHTFETIDSFLANNNLVARSVTVAPDGKLHVTGSAPLSPGSLVKWLTRSGTCNANGLWNWSNEDLFYFTTDKSSSGQEITTDPSGNLFAIGSANHPDGTQHAWLVRRKPAQ